MPPRRKAAGAAAAKKGKKDIKKEEEVAEEVAAAPADVKAEAAEPEASTSAPATRSSGRTTRRGKKAAEEDVPAAVAVVETVAVEAVLEQKPDVKTKIEVEEQVITATPATQAEDVKTQVKDAATDPASEAPPEVIDAELDSRASIESSTAAPASRGGAPDIIGVVEEREDEDIIPDDTEPAPNDSEELKRLAERPMNAVTTSSVPPSLFPKSQRAAGKRAQETASLQDEVMAESSTSVNGSVEPADSSDGAESSLQARMQKMNALRKRMNESFTANRKDVVAAQNEHRKALSESKRLERKRKQAEAMGEKLEAMETGEDLERKRNWEYSLADNEAWNKKQAKKERRADTGFSTFDESARRKYRRDMDNFKPDLKAYNAQKAAALGIEYVEAEAAGELMPHASTSTGMQVVPGSDTALYQDANAFAYADHKPSDDAIDRVVGKLNLDIDKRAKRSRARVEDEGDITYINDRNKVFNKKLERYFNKVSSLRCTHINMACFMLTNDLLF